MQYSIWIDIVPLCVVVVTAAVWLAYRMIQPNIPIGEALFAKKDFDSLASLIDRVRPGQWDVWLEMNVKELTAYLCRAGKFGLADEVWHHLARIRSFQTLVTKLALTNQMPQSESLQVERLLKQFDSKSLDVISIWFAGSDMEKNETTDSLIKMLKARQKLVALIGSRTSPAAAILRPPPEANK